MTNASARAAAYRNKAGEIRAIASAMKVRNVRAILFGIAQDYLKIADLLDNALQNHELCDPLAFAAAARGGHLPP